MVGALKMSLIPQRGFARKFAAAATDERECSFRRRFDCSKIMCLSNGKWPLRKRLCLRRRAPYRVGGISEQSEPAVIPQQRSQRTDSPFRSSPSRTVK